ncbi:predicted protein [Botrytis cinerea T4]|uniref:Uncharacterized protein n=1 Tax=Botryotinia fuckeliana (strain T4) TaxID=999810 RepID=G2XSH1_BOTF4|nr:predicted protein [Botrytis cinerea T4]
MSQMEKEPSCHQRGNFSLHRQLHSVKVYDQDSLFWNSRISIHCKSITPVSIVISNNEIEALRGKKKI